MPLDEGSYYVVSATDTTKVLSIAAYTRGASNRINGSNVMVRTMVSTDDQVWQVTVRPDGTYRITSRFTGKSLDVQSVSAGGNVQMWTDTTNRFQSWDVAETGSTVTYDGTAYPSYSVTLHDRSLVLATSGSNAVLGTGASWLFVPIPKLQSGGVYELVLRLDKRYALDVTSGSKSNGANIILTGRHNANEHKWVLLRSSGDRWTLRNINSGKYAEVMNGVAKELQNVQQWGYAATSTYDRMMWNPVAFGETETVNGVDCEVVKMYSWVDGGGATYLMDANQNKKLDLGNICIVKTDPDTEGQYSQQWCLYPTRATDPNMAMPSGLGWVRAVGDLPAQTRLASQERLYPTWTCTDAWATSGPNHYEWRWRVRYLDATRATWDGFGPWTAWATAPVTVDGTQSWVTDGLDTTYDTDLYKGIHYQYEVRTVGVGETAAIIGKSVTGDVYAFDEPVTDIGTDAGGDLDVAGFGPAGLRFDWRSNYPGTNRVQVTSVKRDGKELLPSPYGVMFYGDSATSFTIPTNQLSDWLDDGDEITATWRVGTDQMVLFDTEHTKTLEVSYGAGSGTVIEPTVTMGTGRKLLVTLPTAKPTKALYLRTPDGKVTTCKANADGTYSVEYPFNSGFELFAMASSTDNDEWDYWYQAYGPNSGLMLEYPPCHAWDWDGGSFLLECDSDPLQTDRTISAIYEADALNKRKWQSVFMAHTMQSEYTAVGLLFTGVTESVKADLIALMEARHVRYRAPSGEVAEVAVTDVSYQTHREYTKVSVSMIEETR